MTLKEYKHDAIARKPTLLYHVTFGKKTIDNIQQNGLEPKLQLPQNFSGVFFTRTKQKALAIGRSIKWRRNLHDTSMFVLTIDSSKLTKLFYDDSYASGVYTTEHVPASAILSVEQVS
jgi:RNA:NAD 2'-phosphotransferase (TPT1/KptA family)